MHPVIKQILIKAFPYKVRAPIKRQKRKLNRIFKKIRAKKTSIEQIHHLLEKEFQITEGDNLIISSSFGNLNASFSPEDLVLLLQEIVGPKGNILMPFYPPGNSYEWAKSGKVFNMRTTPSSMGVLTQVFSERSDVYKSKHPTKALVAWGNDAQEIVAGHENSTTPYYWDSPYGWLLKNPSKSLGIGVPNRPIIHACEDVLFKKMRQYLKNNFTLLIKDYDGTIIEVNTFVHNYQKTKPLKEMNVILKKMNLSTYKEANIGLSFCYIFNNQELFRNFKNCFIKDYY
jgi:aminoglycoside 3-N-acetyltransferase